MDKDLIAQSLEKTGRLVVVHEDTKTCGFGQHIISEITSDPATFGLLFSSPQLVARPDVHIGYNPIYEYAALPSTDDVIAACRIAIE
jgi:2-oxoisovalerate dehydrogenase E1 component